MKFPCLEARAAKFRDADRRNNLGIREVCVELGKCELGVSNLEPKILCF